MNTLGNTWNKHWIIVNLKGLVQKEQVSSLFVYCDRVSFLLFTLPLSYITVLCETVFRFEWLSS